MHRCVCVGVKRTTARYGEMFEPCAGKGPKDPCGEGIDTSPWNKITKKPLGKNEFAQEHSSTHAKDF